MADITLSFTTTATQDAKLASALAWVNARRVELGNTAFPTVNAWLRDMIIEGAKQAISDSDVREQTDVRKAYKAATEAQQTQIKTILGIS